MYDMESASAISHWTLDIVFNDDQSRLRKGRGALNMAIVRLRQRRPWFLSSSSLIVIAKWREDFNTARPHSSLGYQVPAAYAEIITATGSDVR
jgi:hypothetical protein